MREFLADIDMGGNALRRFRVDPMTTADRDTLGATLGPDDAGREVYDLTQKLSYQWDGTAWAAGGAGFASGLHFDPVDRLGKLGGALLEDTTLSGGSSFKLALLGLSEMDVDAQLHSWKVAGVEQMRLDSKLTLSVPLQQYTTLVQPAGTSGLQYYDLLGGQFMGYRAGVWKPFLMQGDVLPYTLPVASATVLGGIKIGAGLSIDAGGVLTNTGTSQPTNQVVYGSGTGISSSVGLKYDPAANMLTTTGQMTFAVNTSGHEIYFTNGGSIATGAGSLSLVAAVGSSVTLGDSTYNGVVSVAGSNVDIAPAGGSTLLTVGYRNAAYVVGITGTAYISNGLMVGTTAFAGTEKLRVNGNLYVDGLATFGLSGQDTFYFTYGSITGLTGVFAQVGTASKAWTLLSAGVPAIVMNASQQVKIGSNGTFSASEKLRVGGDIYVDGHYKTALGGGFIDLYVDSGTAKNPQFLFGTTVAGGNAQWSAQADGTTQYGALDVYVVSSTGSTIASTTKAFNVRTGNTHILSLYGNGNAGLPTFNSAFAIGSTTASDFGTLLLYNANAKQGFPAAAQATNAGLTVAVRNDTDNKEYMFVMGNDSTGGWLQARQTAGFNGANYTNFFLNPNGGSVVIGGTTLNASEKLRVVGGITTTGGAPAYLGFGDNATFEMKSAAGSSRFYMGISVVDNYLIASAGMRLHIGAQSGNTGLLNVYGATIISDATVSSGFDMTKGYMLHLHNNNGNTDTALALYPTTGTTPNAVIGVAALGAANLGDVYFKVLTANNLSFFTNNVERFRVASDGSLVFFSSPSVTNGNAFFSRLAPVVPTLTAATGGTLTNYSGYQIAITAVDMEGGESAIGTAVTIATINGTTFNAISASWTAITGAASYKVYLYSGAWRFFGTTTGTTMLVTGLGSTVVTLSALNANAAGTAKLASSSYSYFLQGIKVYGAVTYVGAATDPTAIVNGQLYYNSTANAFKGYINGAWAPLLSGAGLTTGTLPYWSGSALANSGLVQVDDGNGNKLIQFPTNATAVSNGPAAGSMYFDAGVSKIRQRTSGGWGYIVLEAVQCGGALYLWNTGTTQAPSNGWLWYYTTDNTIKVGRGGTTHSLQTFALQASTTVSTATFTPDFSKGNVVPVTLGANITISFSGIVAGEEYILKFTQDATGGRTVTWPAATKWPGGTTPVITATAGKTDIVKIWHDGVNYWAKIDQNY